MFFPYLLRFLDEFLDNMMLLQWAQASFLMSNDDVFFWVGG